VDAPGGTGSTTIRPRNNRTIFDMPRARKPYALPVWKMAKLDYIKSHEASIPRRVSTRTAGAQLARERTAVSRAREKAEQKAANIEARSQTRAMEKAANIEARAQARAMEKAANIEAKAREKARQKAAKREAKVQEHAREKAERKASKREARSQAKIAARDAKAKERYPSRQLPFAGRPGVKRTVVSGQLVCLDCGPRPIAEFRVIVRKQVGRTYYESRCDHCRQTRCAARNQNLPPEAYRSMMKASGGKCAICGKTAKLVLDHCHETGRVRGMLCAPCNQALAPLEKDPDVVQRMAEYLRYWRDAPMTEAERAQGIERERRRLKIIESSKRSKAKSQRRLIQMATA